MLGLAAHALLEKLALLRITHTWENARAALEDERPRLAAQIRAAGLSRIEAARFTEAALAVAVATSHNPTGQWVLDPHLEADSEVRWTGLLGGEIRNVQADRVFRAGPEPLEPGDSVWWIVDYKTAFTPGSNPRGGVPFFDATQLTLPALGSMGNARRRFFSGPGMENLDATLSKTISIEGTRTLEVRAEAFNLVNHAQFFGASTVQGNVSSSDFGQAVSAMPPRLMQLALRYRF